MRIFAFVGSVRKKLAPEYLLIGLCNYKAPTFLVKQSNNSNKSYED